MKNILLLGDSIRLGYQEKAAELLGENIKIYAPSENCRFTKYALWGVQSWMAEFGNPKLDVVHFNTGIWDLHRCTADGENFTSPEEYRRDIRRLACQLKSYTDNVCFANIIPGGVGLDGEDELNALINTDADNIKVRLTSPSEEWNRNVRLYNNISEQVMFELGIPVNDMYSALISDTDKYISSDGIHPTEAGYNILAETVAKKIKEML